MTVKRRDILGVLGLGAAAATVSTESMATTLTPGTYPGVPGLGLGGPEYQRKVADALENLARAIRQGDASAIGVQVYSELKLDEWLTHKVTFEVEVPLEPNAPLS